MPVDTEFCFEGMKCPSYTNRQLRLPRQILNEFSWNVSQDNSDYFIISFVYTVIKVEINSILQEQKVL